MKGTDLTKEQLRAAEIFILETAGRRVGMDAPSGIVTMQFDAMVRLLAWYGAVRFKAARDGSGGTLENPGAAHNSASECLCIASGSVNGECPQHGDKAQVGEKAKS